MKIVLFLHELALGGTTVNAIDLAAALRDTHGCDVILFAPRGPMSDLAERSGLRVAEAPAALMHPHLPRMRALRALVRHERPDLVHVWETWPLMDAYLAIHVTTRVPLLLTDMQMTVARLLPRSIPTTFGTPDLVQRARARGIRNVSLLLPPVDLRTNEPGSHESAKVRQGFGVAPGEVLAVIVSRLEPSMKGESLLYAVDAMATLGRDLPMRLLIVGDGVARKQIELRAAKVNAKLGRKAILVPGALLDPRPAYAAADVVIGMGGSALRAMAYAKPVIVVGEQGFASPLTPETAPGFYHRGLFGTGCGAADANRLEDELRALAASPERRELLGAFALEFVRSHFSLDTVASDLKQLCDAAVVGRPRRADLISDCLRTGAIYMRERRFLWRAHPDLSMPRGEALPTPRVACDSLASSRQSKVI
jgi:glycosyltransferase involved in cell wall biosynthesis